MKIEQMTAQTRAYPIPETDGETQQPVDWTPSDRHPFFHNLSKQPHTISR